MTNGTPTADTFTTPRGWARWDVLVASLGINLLSLALPIVILQIYDRILPNQAIDTFVILLWGLVGVVLVEAALRVGRSSIMGWVGARFEHLAAVSAVDRILTADINAYEREAAGGYLDRLQSLDGLREFYSGQGAIALVDLPFVTIFLALIWFIAGWLVVIPLLLLVVFGLISWRLGDQLREALHRRNAMDDRRYNFMIEAFNGIHTIKSMAMEPLMLRRYERLAASSADSIVELGKLNATSQSLAAAFNQIAMVAVVAIGAVYVIDNQMTIGALAASTLLTGRALQPVLRAMGMWTQYQGISLARDRMRGIFALPRELKVAERQARPTLSGRIKLDDVGFRFGEDQDWLFQNLSLDIRAGETIGLRGENGVGKSTLVHILLGMVPAEAGRVLFDDIDVREIDPVTLRSQIAYMPQQGSLFQGSLIDNLTMFRDGEAIEQAIEIADMLGLREVIERLPRGLNTRVGDSAVESLPDGVRQRIVMARALVGDPPILLFDDASAALDYQSDQQLRAVLERLRGTRTMVLISHRPSLINICDRVFEIKPDGLAPMGPGSGAMTAPMPPGPFNAAPPRQALVGEPGDPAAPGGANP